MKELLQNLITLQSIEFGEIEEQSASHSQSELRDKIPSQILGHYDRLVARGKKGITMVHNQICTGCHMRVPLGVIMTLRHGTDIQLCDNCGRYLYLADAAEAEVVEPPLLPKSKKKTQKQSNSLLTA